MYNVYMRARDKEQMMKIITTNTSNRAMYAVLDELAKNDFNKGRHVVIVPDSYALSAEKAVFERLEINGSMNIEVASFIRFAKKVLGKTDKHVLSKQGAVLFFQKVVEKNADKLVHYRKAALNAGFSGEMYAVISSIRNNGVSIGDLEESLQKLNPSSTTYNKTKDILLLYREYLLALKNYHDGTTRLEAFIEKMPSSKKVTDCYFYIFGFDALSEMQIEIITALEKFSKGVTIGLMLSNNGLNHSLYPYEVIERLTLACQSKKIKYQVVDGGYEVIKQPFGALHGRLFASSDDKVENKGGAVTLFKEADIYEQYNAVCREIIRLVRREGYRYKDIAIIDCECSATDLKSIFARYGIPYFLDEKEPIASSLIYRFIDSVLDVARYGFKQDKVRVLIKNPLFSDDSRLVSRFENYILAEKVNYNGFDEVIEDKDFEECRQRLLGLVLPFRGEKQVHSFVESIKKVLESPSFISLWERALLNVPEQLRAYNTQALESFNAVLEEYVGLLGSEKESTSSFKRILNSSCVAENITLIPRFIDAVYVGALKESCIIKNRAIFVLGATLQSLPRQDNYKAIISSMDLERLVSSGVRLYPTPLDRVREERFRFIDLLAKTDKLYVGYPESAFDATQNKPSEVIRDLSRIMGIAVKSLNARFYVDGRKSVEEIEDAVGSRNNAFYTYVFGGGLSEEKSANLNAIYNSLTLEEKELLLRPAKETHSVSLTYTFGKDRHSKVSQLEQYFTCPYRHYLQYGLKLRERKEGALEATDVGTVVHRILEIYFKSTLGKLRTLTEDEIENYALNAIEKAFEDPSLAYLLKDPSTAYLVRRIKEESKKTVLGLTANVLKGDFTPTHVELSFNNKDGSVKPISFSTENGEVRFYGQIDRVDTFKQDEEKFAIAIDYKTGHVSADLKSVYYGIKVQLYVYLLALKSNLGYRPVGAFYLPIKSGYTTQSDKGQYRFVGQFAAREDIMLALDREVFATAQFKAENGEDGKKTTQSTVLPTGVSYTKKGDLKLSIRKPCSEEDIDKICDYVGKIIPIALKEIEEGYIERSPLTKDTCKHCAYKPICGGAKEGQIRAKGDVTPLEVSFTDCDLNTGDKKDG